MVIETILSSIGEKGRANFAPIGVHLTADCCRILEAKEIEISLYPGSNTYLNLKSTPEGVINLTDDVLTFVDTALFSLQVPAVPSARVRPPRMAEAKTVLEFVVTSFDESVCPARLKGTILLCEESGTYAGYCRAQGVVLEAAIAATRLQWISESKIVETWPSWQEIVVKTGGPRELEAFRKLADYLVRHGISIPVDSLQGCTQQ